MKANSLEWSPKVQLVSVLGEQTETVQILYGSSKGTHVWQKAMHTCMTNNLINETNYILPTEYHPPLDGFGAVGF